MIVDPSWFVGLPQDKSPVNEGQGIGSLLPKLGMFGTTTSDRSEPTKGRFIFSTPQSLLLCDATLDPAESKTSR